VDEESKESMPFIAFMVAFIAYRESWSK